mmetsp:Transcript_20263/g.42112  ORF Transcript_20263/g.42112 Transcript_20263/m.42112 type:complete len:92 (+) Transcript_20263:183-458(+)
MGPPPNTTKHNTTQHIAPGTDAHRTIQHTRAHTRARAGLGSRTGAATDPWAPPPPGSDNKTDDAGAMVVFDRRVCNTQRRYPRGPLLHLGE